jgi:predicted nucleotidyltransferase
METATPPPFLRRVVDRYVRAFAPERIVLFGSYAKGMNHAGSDVDLLVVANLPDGAPHQQRRARQLAADCFPPVDVVFATPEELAEADTAASPFLLSILGTGIVIYRRPESSSGSLRIGGMQRRFPAGR